MARDRFLTNATDDLPETETKRHAPTIQDLYLMPNQGAEAVISGSRDGRAWEQRQSRLGAEAVASGSRDGHAWEQRRSRLKRDHLNVGRRLLTSRIFIKAVLK